MEPSQSPPVVLRRILTKQPNLCASNFARRSLELNARTPRELMDDRYDKFRRMGNFFTDAVPASGAIA